MAARINTIVISKLAAIDPLVVSATGSSMLHPYYRPESFDGFVKNKLPGGIDYYVLSYYALPPKSVGQLIFEYIDRD